MVKKAIILLVLNFFPFYLTSLRGFFCPLEPEPLEKKIPGAGAGAAWEKNQEPEPLEKKVRSRSR